MLTSSDKKLRISLPKAVVVTDLDKDSEKERSSQINPTSILAGRINEA